MTDFSKIFSGQSKNEIKPQIHDRRPALSQSFPSRSTTGDSTTVREQSAKRRDWNVYALSSASARSPVCRFLGKCPRLHGSFRVDDPGPESQANLGEHHSTPFTPVRSASPLSRELQSRTGAFS